MHKRSITAKYGDGEIVYVKTDPYQYKHQVSGYLILPGGGWMYQLKCDESVRYCYPLEVTHEEGEKKFSPTSDVEDD